MPTAANPLSAAVDALLDIAADLGEQKAELMAKIDANRQTLRNLRVQGAASDEQAEEIETRYPTRTRNTNGDQAEAPDA